jgi:hypothetical protein
MYCTQVIHTCNNHRRPVRVTKAMFDRKHCTSKNGGKKCHFLFIDEKGVLKRK